MAMLDDESDPTYFADCNFSSSSSINSLFSDGDINYCNNIKMKRRKSLSLYNISTPCAKFKTCDSNNRSKSYYDMEQIGKPKRNNYAHVQSKVRKYIIAANKEHEESKKRRLAEEQKIREELRNLEQHEDAKMVENLGMGESLEHQDGLPQFEPNEEGFLRNFEPFQQDPVIEQFEQPSEQYTPDFRHESKPIYPQSLIKTLLFKPSPAIRSRSIVNTPRGNSTCRTIDVQDSPSNESLVENKDVFIAFNNNNSDQFLAKSISPISNVSSSAPLLDFQKSAPKHGVRKMFGQLLNCPKFLKRKQCSGGAIFKNKIYPDYKVPQVVIVSPDSGDSGNQSDLPTSRNKNREFRNSTKNNLHNIQLSQNQEFQLEELVQCADELTYRINVFKILAQDFLTTNND